MSNKNRLVLIDAMSVIYRAFHAMPIFATSKGVTTNATLGFTNSTRKIIDTLKPTHMAFCFDMKAPTFRTKLFKDYKMERPPMPDELSVQIPYIKKMVEALNITLLQKEGFEADDIIGTITEKFIMEELEIFIVTGDKDLCQLVSAKVKLYDQMKDKIVDIDAVNEKFGLGPESIVEMLGLAGDKSDNIPGVPGVGPKTATKLLKEYDSFEGIYENIDSIKQKKLNENLQTYKDQAILSVELATIHKNVPVEFSLDDFLIKEVDVEKMEPLLNELEFTRLKKDLLPEKKTEIDGTVIENEKDFLEVLKKLKKEKEVFLSLNFYGTEKEVAGNEKIIKGASFASSSVAPFYADINDDLKEDVFIKGIKEILEDEKIIKVADSSKDVFTFSFLNDIDVKNLSFDLNLASYLLNPVKTDHSLASSVLEEEGETLEKDLFKITKEDTAGAFIKRAHFLNIIKDKYEKKLKDTDMFSLLQTMEIPLSKVLAKMELTGIKVDKKFLEHLSLDLEKKLKTLEAKLFKKAGTEFNVSSPKQLSKVLFEDLGLEPVKKTKTGFSTDEETLRQLSETHEVPEMIISFRQMAKLKSTYVDGILPLINSQTGRVHSTFNQTVTATGRLSSSRPNLQNIPIRNEVSKKIRRAFISEEGYSFISADYSQIELRLVAHLSQDETLLNAFKEDKDVHAMTASTVFEVPIEEVTEELRRRAKAINFGIIYGMGAFGLARELKIPVYEAKEYIETYFVTHRKVREFIDAIIETTREKGYSETLYKRRRTIAELQSNIDSQRKLGERLAVNTPIQGSAADIIKVAMINLESALREENLFSRIVLQVHDELIVEVKDSEKEKVKEMLKNAMEDVLNLEIPLKTNINIGKNWQEAK